jgi:group I intron endonuclease
MIAIYSLKNTLTGDFYIGSSVNVLARKSTHFSKLRNNYHDNKKLQIDWIKYGKDAFTVDIIKSFTQEITEGDLRKEEAEFIKNLKPTYNCVRAGEKRKRKTNPEVFKSIDFKNKMKAATLNYWAGLSEEDKEKRNKHKHGRVFSQETRNKLSIAARARKWSDATKKKISDSLKNRS